MNLWKMYATLCAACSKAIDKIDQNDYFAARAQLQKALWDAEEMYIAPDTIRLFAESKGEYYIQENERLKSDPSAAVRDTLRARCLETINKAFSSIEK